MRRLLFDALAANINVLDNIKPQPHKAESKNIRKKKSQNENFCCHQVRINEYEQ